MASCDDGCFSVIVLLSSPIKKTPQNRSAVVSFGSIFDRY